MIWLLALYGSRFIPFCSTFFVFLLANRIYQLSVSSLIFAIFPGNDDSDEKQNFIFEKNANEMKLSFFSIIGAIVAKINHFYPSSELFH